MAFNWIERYEIFVICEFELLVLIHGDFCGEVDISIEEVSDDVNLALFIREVGSVEFDFVKDIFLSIEEILFSCVW